MKFPPPTANSLETKEVFSHRTQWAASAYIKNRRKVWNFFYTTDFFGTKGRRHWREDENSCTGELVYREHVLSRDLFEWKIFSCSAWTCNRRVPSIALRENWLRPSALHAWRARRGAAGGRTSPQQDEPPRSEVCPLTYSVQLCSLTDILQGVRYGGKKVPWKVLEQQGKCPDLGARLLIVRLSHPRPFESKWLLSFSIRHVQEFLPFFIFFSKEPPGVRGEKKESRW